MRMSLAIVEKEHFTPTWRHSYIFIRTWTTGSRACQENSPVIEIKSTEISFSLYLGSRIEFLHQQNLTSSSFTMLFRKNSGIIQKVL